MADEIIIVEKTKKQIAIEVAKGFGIVVGGTAACLAAGWAIGRLTARLLKDHIGKDEK